VTAEPWPELPWTEWKPTLDTLHLWIQIVGKVRMALAAPLNHWWHTTLYVTSRGLTTSPIPVDGRDFQVDFDFIDHRVNVSDTDGRTFTMAIEPRSVATFYTDFMAGLRGLGIDVRIWTMPVEVADPIPFEQDDRHASYDPMQAQLFWRALLQADRVMKEFQARFVGKVSPVHLFWGGLDLATSRYSGRPAPLHPGGIPNTADWVNEEAYSREEFAAGWWASTDPPGPAFYSYTYPEPDGIAAALLRPAEAFFDSRLDEFALTYDAVRAAADPDAAVLDFFQSTYEAGADLAGWDRALLEPAEIPSRPPKRPWSIMR
jgi:Family of unknown function (DUF5996)